MEFFISKSKKLPEIVYILKALVLSFLVCLTIFSDRAISITNINEFFYAINGNNILSLPLFVLLFVIFGRYLKLFDRELYTKNFLFTVLISLCFASFETVGYNIDKFNKLFYPYLNIYTFTFNLLIFFEYFIIFYFFTNLIIKIINSFTNKVTEFDKEFKYFSNNIRSVFFVSGILILFWSVYYFIFFPAVVTWDSYYQIEQGLGFRNLTDENPFIHTLFQGFIINIGSKILGSINLGISVFCIVQMIFITLVIAVTLKIMAKHSVPVLYRIISFLMYLLNPLIGIYSITLWKDIWVATFLLAYSVLLIDLCIDTYNFFESKFKVLCFILVILFVMLSKGTGIIYIVFSLIPLLFMLSKKYLFRLSIAYFIPFITFFLIKVVVIPYFGIQKGHIREPLSVPVQQIARTVVENKENIDERDKREINEILPYDEIPELYKPRISDNIKGVLNENVYSQNPIKYAKLWLRLGFKYPKCYLESILSNSYGYWYPETKYWVISRSSYIKMLNFYKENNWKIYDENIENYPQGESLIKSALCHCLDNIRDIPLLSLIFSIAFYFWIEFFISILCLKNKQQEMLPIFFIIIASFIVCIMSPVHAEMRYAYPAVFILPVIFSFGLFKMAPNNTSRE